MNALSSRTSTGPESGSRVFEEVQSDLRSILYDLVRKALGSIEKEREWNHRVSQRLSKSGLAQDAAESPNNKFPTIFVCAGSGLALFCLIIEFSASFIFRTFSKRCEIIVCLPHHRRNVGPGLDPGEGRPDDVEEDVDGRGEGTVEEGTAGGPGLVVQG